MPRRSQGGAGRHADAAVTDETTGQQATDFWDRATGKGTIGTPNVHPRPALYAVAAVCLRLKMLDEIDPAEVA
jgi:hypothetical protein